MWRHLYNTNCPPPNATEEDINPVYRLIENSSNITIKNFEPRYIKFPNRNFADPCAAKGTSVFDDYVAIKAQHKRMSKARKKKLYIAKGYISKTDGKLLQKGHPHHITWWIVITNPQNKFKAIP